MKKRVFDIIGEPIKKYGFVFLDEPAYKGIATWTFAREVDSIKQIITIMKDRFSEALHMRFQTTAWQSGLGTPVSQLIISDKYNTDEFGGWPYQNDEDFERVLREFLEIIEKYGLDELTRLSIEEDVIPTVEMGEKLFSLHEILNEQFILQNKINVSDRSKENKSKWFEIIEEKVVATYSLPYSQVQDILVEIAAFLGVQITRDLGGEWVKNKDARGIWIGKLNTYILDAYWPLANVINSWKYQNIEYLKEDYFLVLDAKLPLTESQMIDIAEKFNIHQSKGFNS